MVEVSIEDRVSQGTIDSLPTLLLQHQARSAPLSPGIPRTRITRRSHFTRIKLEVDIRGSAQDVLARLEKSAGKDKPKDVLAQSGEDTTPGPGRPKLGVIGHEVTLLPRHWDWLNSQPGGASVTLRRLVEAAKRPNAGQDRVRVAREATYRFMVVMGGNLPGFEEATRVLFAKTKDRFKEFEKLVRVWPGTEPINAPANSSGCALRDFPPRIISAASRTANPSIRPSSL